MPLAHNRLLARRVPRDKVILGRAYVIHARNGGVGVAVTTSGSLLGYKLRRTKFGTVYLFTEVDWADDEKHGTAIPLQLLPDTPPQDRQVLLEWLADREKEHASEIAAAWDVVLG